LIVRVLRSEQTTVFVLGLLLTTYLVLRAIYTPMLHDEIATFFYFIQPKDFLPPTAHWDANNHVLNSFLGNLSFQLFGDAPWALRLPNVILYPVYLFFSWKIASQIDAKTIRWTLFLSLVSTSYLFEYFALCRGYGMSLGFMLWAFFLFIQNQSNLTNKLLIIFISFLAVTANLTLIYVYLMLVVLTLFQLLRDKSKSRAFRWGNASIIGLSSAILAIPLVYFSFELKARGALYYGGNSFIDFTIKPITKLVFGLDSTLFVLSLMFVTSIIIAVSLWRLVKNFDNTLITKNLFTILLVGSVAAILMSHYLLGVNFPEDRTAMYLIPLFFLSIGFTLEQTKLKFSKLLALPLLIIPIKFISNIDVKNVLFAIEERHIQEYFDYIEEQAKDEQFKPSVGGYATQSFCWYYMNYRSNGQQNAMLYSTHPDTICDYQILNAETDFSEAFYNLYTKLNSASINKQNLFIRNNSLQRTHLLTIENITNWNHSNNAFFNLAEVEIEHKWADKAFLIEISGILHAPRKPFYATLTASQKDADWNEISQERSFLSWMRYDWSDDNKTFSQRLILPKINSNSAYLQVFLWNIKEQPCLLKDCTVQVYLLY
jgi:hypothetical protein